MRLCILLALFTLSGCQSCREIGGGAGLDLPLLDVVYECAHNTGALELCWDGGESELEQSLAANGYAGARCSPTSRHLGPCIHCCGPDCGRGANAYNGSWCPPATRLTSTLWSRLLRAPVYADSCDSPQVMPATDCRNGELKFGGCRWRCESEPRQ